MRHHARTARHVCTVAGVVLLVAGVIALIVAVRAQRSAPQPPASAASFVPAHTTHAHARATHGGRPTRRPRARKTPRARTSGPVLGRSIPTRLDIPAIGVSSPLTELGLQPDGTVQVPPLSRDSHAAWYKFSPTPGQLGPAVILGHVDSAAYGPGVFFRLGDLRQRDRVDVTRADHTVAVFQVQRVVEYRKANFPTLAVYGNTRRAALRLITCGGTFDSATGNYESNIVVYAALIGSHPERDR